MLNRRTYCNHLQVSTLQPPLQPRSLRARLVDIIMLLAIDIAELLGRDICVQLGRVVVGNFVLLVALVGHAGFQRDRDGESGVKA